MHEHLVDFQIHVSQKRSLKRKNVVLFFQHVFPYRIATRLYHDFGTACMYIIM